MISRSPSVSLSNTRSLSIASLLVLFGAAVLPVPGCSDPPELVTNCAAADLVNTDTQDCQKPVCQSGVAVKQADDTEVPDDGNECTTDTCADGKAQHASATGACTVGGAAGTCFEGLCKVTCAQDGDCNDSSSCTTDTCDKTSLTCTFADDPANYDDKNDCTVDTCAAGVEKHDNAPVNTNCGATGISKCDGNGVCKGCASDADCAVDEPCVDHYCDTATTLCKSMAKPDGPLADDTAGDCKVSECLGGLVVMNPNNDDLPNDNNECTVDLCTDGNPTNVAAVAETMCSAGVCDGVSACVQCVTATNCMGDFSCATNMCFDCNDAVKNGTESDIDCGSDCSTQCADGKMCAANADCGSNICDNNVCVSCGDGVKNGTESDFDCGGLQCPKCNTGQNCNAGTDCAQGVCNGGKCAAATCMDGVKNGAESDIDCGGSTCPKCAAGKMCTKDGDCGGGTKCLMNICG